MCSKHAESAVQAGMLAYGVFLALRALFDSPLPLVKLEKPAPAPIFQEEEEEIDHF